MNYKMIAIIEAVILILFAAFHFMDLKEREIPKEGLLSPRVYANVLQPQSRLIYNFEPLEEGIRDYVSKINGTIAVYILNLRDGASIGMNEEIQFEPASLNKLPIAILTFRGVEKGEISLDDKLTISENYMDKSSGMLFRKVGQQITFKEAIDEMLVNSDNTAAKMLLARINPKEWNALAEYLNSYQKDDKLSQAYYVTSAESTVNLFSSLYLSTLLKEENSEYILKKLTESKFPMHKLANIPTNVKIAQKFGTYYYNKEEYYHNCGIIYFEEGSRLGYCIMTQNLKGSVAEEVIADIVEATYKYTVEKNKLNIERL